MVDASVVVVVDNESRTIKVEDLDFDMNRDQLALSLGRMVIDNLWTLGEGK